MVRHFVLRYRKLKQILLQATKGGALAIVMSGTVDEAAQEAWSKLVRRYEGDKQSRIELLHGQLFQPRLLRSAEDINKHLQEILDIADSLRDLDEPVSYRQLKGVIDRSLPALTYEATTLREAKRGDLGDDDDPNTLHKLCDAETMP